MSLQNFSPCIYTWTEPQTKDEYFKSGILHKPPLPGSAGRGLYSPFSTFTLAAFSRPELLPPTTPCHIPTKESPSPSVPQTGQNRAASPSLLGSPLWSLLGQKASFHPLGGGRRLFSPPALSYSELFPTLFRVIFREKVA